MLTGSLDDFVFPVKKIPSPIVAKTKKTLKKAYDSYLSSAFIPVPLKKATAKMVIKINTMKTNWTNRRNS